MATDGPDPPPCDPELYERGVSVGVFDTYGANHFEALVKQVAAESGRKVDWFYCGGRAVVKSLPRDAEHVIPFVGKIIRPSIEEKRREFLARE